MDKIPDLPEPEPLFKNERRRVIVVSSIVMVGLAVVGCGAFLWISAQSEEESIRLAAERQRVKAERALRKRAAEKARQLAEQEKKTPAPQPEAVSERSAEISQGTVDELPPPVEETSPDSETEPPPPAAEPAPVHEPDDAVNPAPLQPETEQTPAPSPLPQPIAQPQEEKVQSIDVTDAPAYEAAVLRAVSEGQYTALAQGLIPGIRAAAQGIISGNKLNYAAYRRSDSFMSAVELSILINTVGERQLRELTHGKEAGSGKQFLNWMLRDRCRPLRCFIRNFMVQEGDVENMAYALRTLFCIWKETPEQDRGRYLNLAMACALLSPETVSSPGLIRVKTPLLTPAQIFQYFREQDRHRRLLTDVKKMSVERLLLVVDFRLPMSELKWVTKNLKYDRATWADKAYSSVRYLMERATRDADPYTTYTFEEILKEGGVCRDQAYFAANSAKIMGIPAVIAVGDGDRGPHAWVVAQVSDTEWKQVNSYGYTTGVFDNPCSGREHHESMLLSRTKRDNTEKFNALADGLAFSRFMGSIQAHEEALGAARYVVGAFPENTAAWDNLVEVMEAETAPKLSTEEWQQVHRRMLRHTRKNTELNDLAAYVEDEYLMCTGNAAARKAAMERNIRTMRRNVGDSRSDLVVEAINRQASILSEKKDVRGLLRLYKKELKEVTARGDVFQELLSQCVMHYSEAAASEREWGTLAKEVEKLFERHIRSGGADYFKLSKEVEIQKQLVELYENAGNVKKANRIYRDAVQRLEHAEHSEDE